VWRSGLLRVAVVGHYAAAIIDIADDLSAWLRSRINAKVANERSPSALEPQETPK